MPRDTTVIAFRQPEAINDPLTEIAREGARRTDRGSREVVDGLTEALKGFVGTAPHHAGAALARRRRIMSIFAAEGDSLKSSHPWTKRRGNEGVRVA
jgi:hypothetical protein